MFWGKTRWLNQIKNVVTKFKIENARCSKCHAVLSSNDFVWGVEIDTETAIKTISPSCRKCAPKDAKELLILS